MFARWCSAARTGRKAFTAVTCEVIARTIESAKKHGSGVAAVMLKDTIKRVDENGCVIDTPIRDTLRAVQTPQTFDAALIRQAHQRFENGNEQGLKELIPGFRRKKRK